jgi:adenylate cyclase
MIPALVLALGLFAVLFDPFGAEHALSRRLFDAYQRHLPYSGGGAGVTAFDLPAMDEDSLARATRALAASGAKLVVFAAPPDTSLSPQALVAKLLPGRAFDAARAALSRLPEPGHDLAQALTAIKGVVPVVLGIAGRAPEVKGKFLYRGATDPFGKLPPASQGAGALPILQQTAAGIAAFNLPPDPDGVVRRMPLAFRLGDILVPGLAVEALRLAENRPAVTVTTDARDPLSFLAGVGIAGMETAKGWVPADRNGAIHPRFARPEPHRAAVTAGSSLAGTIAVIGPAGLDVQTPLGRDSVAGVVAQSIRALATGEVLARPSWARLAEALLLALAGGAALLLLLRFGLGWAAGLLLGALALFALGSWYLFVGGQLLIDSATPGLTLAAMLAGAALAQAWDVQRARAALRLAFADSLPRATIEKIARQPGLLNIDGELRNVTYLVCGVRGLSLLADGWREDAAGFTRLMREVLTPLIDQVLAHGGTIDRLTAEGFAAFWNAPLADADHAVHACEAANGITIMAARVTEAIALDRKARGLAPVSIEIGVGLATGQAIAGGFGGYGRTGYSVNGDPVVLAGRIQALSHHYGPAVIVAAETRAAAERSFAFLEVDSLGDAGAPVKLYAMLGNPVVRASPKFRALTVFHDHIFQAIRKQQWAKARELIAQCRRLSGASQQLYDLHLARIAYFETHPPGADWDGAFRQILN